jgi:kinetochore protein NDC80
LQLEAQLYLLKKEIQDYNHRCAAEAKKMMEEVQEEAHNLDIVEREAAEVLKVLPFYLAFDMITLIYSSI